jgi:glycosyltransferase involved in cell wall biosynthesis
MEVLLEGGVAARVLGLPHVLHYRGNTLDQPRFVFDVLTATWTALSDRVLCISEATAAVFQRRGRGGKVQVLYNPVDVQRFVDAERSTDVRAALGAGPSDFLIGTVGRLHPRKDLATFLRTAAIVGAAEPRAKFVVVGAADGPAEIAYEAALRALVAELDLADRVTFAGARRDIPSVMKALDLFMLTSRHEGFGRVVAEAMAAARPIVVTREGALPELVFDPATGQACGLCAAAESPDQFATQVLTLMRDQHAAGALADRAVRRARLFDRELVSSRVLALYRSLVDSSANGGVTSTTRPL